MFKQYGSVCSMSIALLAVIILISVHQSPQASRVGDLITKPIWSLYEKVSSFRDRHPTRSQKSYNVAPRNQRNVRNGNSGPFILPGSIVGRVVDTSSDDYNAKCFVQRGPSFKSNPTLFYYSSETHGPETSGCTEDIKIELVTTNSDKDEDPELIFDEENSRNQMINSGLYNGNRPTYFMIHGFLTSWNKNNWMCNIKDMILNNSDANVFIVDWSGGSKPVLPLDYAAAVANTKYVGQLLAAYIKQLMRISGQTDARQFHLIGHSLGAHISGFVGYSIENLGRITGLDPAGPCFATCKKDDENAASKTGFLPHANKRRLSPESAQLVVALHTDTSLFGLNENCADYDVYVNGGYKQPGCGSVSLKSRFADLLSLNLKDSLNPDITCAHSFATKLVDSFASYFSFGNGQAPAKRQAGQISTMQAKTGGDQYCYPMAYECEDWSIFKAGECGFCLSRDTRCVFTGLSSENFQLKKVKNPPVNSDAIERINSISEDDDKFNDEDEDLADDATKKDDDKLKPSVKNSRGQHFMKSKGNSHTCLYHYQIIVAAKRESIENMNNADKHYYYLHIPMETYGRLTGPNGERLHDRLIQISHRIEPGSRAYNLLANEYTTAVSQHDSRIYMQDLEFYSALITFKQAPEDQCRDNETDGSSKSSKWQLCRPFDNILQARLWSSSGEKLDAIRWVAMNFMSGLTYEQRIGNSFLFGRNRGDQVMSRQQIDQTDQASIRDLTPEGQKSTTSTLKGATKKLDCLLSKLDNSAEGKTETNFKCNRSSRELKFALNLRPKKL